MRISLYPSRDLWWGVFLDRNRSCLYIAPLPWLLLQVSWGPQYDFGYIVTSGLTARRDRVTGDIDILCHGRAGTWKRLPFVADGNFRVGSPPPDEETPQ